MSESLGYGSQPYSRGRRMSQRSRSRSRTPVRTTVPWMMKRSRMLAGTTFKFVRVADIGTFMNNGVMLNSAVQSFAFNQIPNYGEFAVLFDEFRLDKIDFYIEMNGTVFDAAGGAAANFVALHTHSAIDTTGGALPTIPSQLQEYSTYKRTKATNLHKRTFYPRCLMSAAAGGRIGSKGGQFFDMNAVSQAEPHYGVKWIVEGTGGVTGTNYNYKTWAKFYFTCRAVR